MRLLFLHQNFPAQWVHLAHHYHRDPGNQVVGLTRRENKQRQFLDVRYYATPEVKLQGLPPPVARFGACFARGQGAAAGMAELKRNGFEPDVVAGHSGWGETLFVKEVWPDTKLLMYGELFYRSRGLDVDFDPEFPEADTSNVIANNATVALAATTADAIVTPTQWQRSTFPASIRERVSVVHEGIDTEAARPNPAATITLGRDQVRLTPSDQVITFIGRNLEPYRGYHTFMRALPKIMRALPRARVILVGGDKVSYGRPPPPGRSWKTVYLDEVKADLDMSRIHFVGPVPHNTLWDVLALSTCHVYLTYPFVLSWSLLEAMSIGCVVVGSATPPVEEVIQDGRNGLLADFFDVDALASRIVDVVANRDRYDHLRTAARQTIIDRYDLRTRCLPQLAQVLERLVPK